jgi:hypothetical protein
MKSLSRFALLFFVATTLVTGCNKPEDNYVSVPQPSPDLPGAPLIPEIAVLRPFFQTTLGSVDVGSSVGTAFAVKPEGSDSSIVLTALSILGPSSGLSRQALPEELSEIYQSVTLGSAFGGFDGVVSATGFLRIPESASFEQESEAGDILAITMPKKSRFGTFKLSNDLPAKGEKIWLSAAMFVGVPPSQRQHSAIVTGQDDHGNITYEFDDRSIGHQGTVGAPILNKKGEVVAIHLGGASQDGKLTGFANPTSRFSKHLEAALSSMTEKSLPPGKDATQ